MEISENFPTVCCVESCIKHDSALENDPTALWNVLQHCTNVTRHVGGDPAIARRVIRSLKAAGLWKRVRDSEILKKQRAARNLEHKLAWDKAHRQLLATRREKYLVATLVRKGLARPPADSPLVLNNTAVLAFDTETTGLSGIDVPIQLGYVLVVNGEVAVECCKIVRYRHCQARMSASAQAIHGISEEDMRNSPHDAHMEITTLAKLMHDVTEAGGVIIGHNLSFDLRMLKQGLPGVDLAGLNTTCTLQLARKLSGHKKGLKLEQIYREIVPVSEREELTAHNALSDSKMALAIYNHRDQMKNIRAPFVW